ncbi:MAG: tRNA uridine-5-carboxymethylaminomethyl(34) synthesis GTPase MnmE [Myxococcales bacterium]|nr:tRNA uridine-5-carboxymethylaminomethyl(34) synthesis GTPase MnmE [Myxococcales bacterium]
MAHASTIAAVATPSGTGGVAIIRISGPAALRVARTLIPDLPESVPPYRMLYREFRDRTGAALDSGLAVFMPGPRSFTGEDVVELHGHGGPVVVDMLLSEVYAAGAHPAEPGEFTRRAFLNGKLDLAQAEGIADLIHARSNAAARLAKRHLEGRLSAEINDIRENLARQLVLVESAIDFSLEEHVYALDYAALTAGLAQAIAQIDRLLASYDRGRVQRDGLTCVIAGRPNAGKSSLLNLLLGEDRAIVSPVAGTTRDYLDAECMLGDQLFRFVDTAGLRATEDVVEAEGVRRSTEQIRKADLAVYIVDASQPQHSDDLANIVALEPPTLLLLSKRDLERQLPAEAFGSKERLACRLDCSEDRQEVETALLELTKKAGLSPTSESVAIARARHRDALESARDALERAVQAADMESEPELVALDLRAALDHVGEIVGHITPDDILGRIFAEFCVGK